MGLQEKAVAAAEEVAEILDVQRSQQLATRRRSRPLIEVQSHVVQQNIEQHNAAIGVLLGALRVTSRQGKDRNQEVQQVERLGTKQTFAVSHVGADEAKQSVVEQSVDLIGGHQRKQQLESFQHHSTID